MVCDENCIQVLGYSHEDFLPYHIVSYSVTQTNAENFAPKVENAESSDKSGKKVGSPSGKEDYKSQKT